jgi:hypothetical protein
VSKRKLPRRSRVLCVVFGNRYLSNEFRRAGRPRVVKDFEVRKGKGARLNYVMAVYDESRGGAHVMAVVI